MKKSLIVISSLITLLVACEVEISPEQADRFIKMYGNHLLDQASDVAVLDVGGYAICGTDSLSGLGKRMVLLVTDEYGNLQNGFPAYYTVQGMESGATDIVPIRGGQGGFLLVGYVEVPVEGTVLTQKDIFLVKVSINGNINWQRTYGSAEDDVVLHATERISSGFMLAGYRVREGRSDIMVMGVEEEGDSIRLGLIINNPYAQNASANYLFNTGEWYNCVCTYDKLGGQGTDVLVLRFDNTLSVLSKKLTTGAVETGSCIIEDGEDRFLVLGNRFNESGRSELVVYRITTSGHPITNSVLIATITEGNADLEGRRFVKTPDGRYAIVGTRTVDGESDLFLQFLTQDYNVGERKLFGSAGNQTGADIELAGDDAMLLLGTTLYENNGMITLMKTGLSGDL